MHIRHFIPVCAVFVLAACAGAQNTRTPAVSSTNSGSEAAAPQTAAPKPSQEPERAPVRDSVRAAPVPAPNPDKLIGLTPDALDKLLGKPNLVRRDGPAEVRLYYGRDRQCTFHIFLYAKAAAGQPSAVEYFEARNTQGRLTGDDISDCYQALVTPAATS